MFDPKTGTKVQNIFSGTCTGTGILLECCLFCYLKLYTMLDFWQLRSFGVGWGGGGMTG